MPDKKKTTFILNDENITNSYGFRVLNAGLVLDRFEKCPVMLKNHGYGTEAVIGRWENIRVEDSQLLADAVFDDGYDAAAQVSGQVERGFIRGASLGFYPKFLQFGEGDIPEYGGEVLEASVVAMPSNKNSVKLYAQDGQQISDNQVQLTLLSIHKKKEISMTEVEKLAKLQAENTAMQLANDAQAKELAALRKEKEDSAKLAATKLIDEAIAEGRLDATEREQFLELANTNYGLAQLTINKLPAKESLNAKIINLGNGKSQSFKSIEELTQKLSSDQITQFKLENPEEYARLLDQEL